MNVCRGVPAGLFHSPCPSLSLSLSPRGASVSPSLAPLPPSPCLLSPASPPLPYRTRTPPASHLSPSSPPLSLRLSLPLSLLSHTAAPSSFSLCFPAVASHPSVSIILHTSSPSSPPPAPSPQPSPSPASPSHLLRGPALNGFPFPPALPHLPRTTCCTLPSRQQAARPPVHEPARSACARAPRSERVEPRQPLHRLGGR